MALLFPWATKEYLLWKMSLGQIIMYHNLGIEIKYPTNEKSKPSVANKSTKEVLKIRDQLRKQYGAIG